MCDLSCLPAGRDYLPTPLAGLAVIYLGQWHVREPDAYNSPAEALTVIKGSAHFAFFLCSSTMRTTYSRSTPSARIPKWGNTWPDPLLTFSSVQSCSQPMAFMKCEWERNACHCRPGIFGEGCYCSNSWLVKIKTIPTLQGCYTDHEVMPEREVA